MNAHSRLLACLLAFLVAACATDRQVIAQADDAHRDLKPAVVKDAELAGYLQALGERIVTEGQKLSDAGYGPDAHRAEDDDWMFTQVKFHFVNSETLNAFTTGGEHMYIYTQLLQQCRTEDELAAVMAHEYGHVYGRHVHKGMNRQYLAIGGALAGGVLGYTLADDEDKEEFAVLGALAGGAAMNMTNMAFTREDEAEADELGFDFYVRAGWDPQRFGDFFQAMVDAGYDTTPEVLSDHPSLASRVQAAKARAAKLPKSAQEWRRPPVADAARFEALKQRARQIAQSMPKDETLAAAQTLLSAMGNCLVPTEQPEQVKARAKIRKVRGE